MIETVAKSIDKIGNQKLTSSILPNSAHRCAMLDLPSYDTTKAFSFEFKHDFKSFKWVCALRPSNFLYWRKLPIEFLIKSQVLCFGISLYSIGFKDYLKAFKNNFKTTAFLNKLIAIHLFIIEATENFISAMDKQGNQALSLFSVASY